MEEEGATIRAFSAMAMKSENPGFSLFQGSKAVKAVKAFKGSFISGFLLLRGNYLPKG